MKRVLFVCVHNSGRSQMAEAFVNRLGEGRVLAESAGTAPTDSLDPRVVEAMREIGYDLSGHRPKMMTLEMAENADRVITMGCGVNLDDVEHEGGVCPGSFLEAEDWGLDDPAGQPMEKVRAIRDQIREKVTELINQLGKEDS